jgi:hypothetical protein
MELTNMAVPFIETDTIEDDTVQGGDTQFS